MWHVTLPFLLRTTSGVIKLFTLPCDLGREDNWMIKSQECYVLSGTGSSLGSKVIPVKTAWSDRREMAANIVSHPLFVLRVHNQPETITFILTVAVLFLGGRRWGDKIELHKKTNKLYKPTTAPPSQTTKDAKKSFFFFSWIWKYITEESALVWRTAAFVSSN